MVKTAIFVSVMVLVNGSISGTISTELARKAQSEGVINALLSFDDFNFWSARPSFGDNRASKAILDKVADAAGIPFSCKLRGTMDECSRKWFHSIALLIHPDKRQNVAADEVMKRFNHLMDTLFHRSGY